MSMRYPGGLLTAATPVNAQYPSGVWTQAQTIPYVQQNVWQRDVYWPYTTLLLHGDGTNGAQNNTFLDSSSNNFTITRNGNTTQGSFTPFQQDGYWSNYFDGSGDYLTTSSSITTGTGNFTVEAWIWTTVSNQKPEIWQRSSLISDFVVSTNFNAADAGVILGETTTAGSGYTTLLVASTVLTANAWNHVAWVRSSGTITVYINGVASGTVSSAINSQSLGTIGAFSAATYDFSGYISNLRVTNTAVYTSAFTPSTTPLTAISGTSLLTCQSNRFKDNSSNAFAITVNGNTAVQAFQPFPGFTTWGASVLGGSGYFDGSGDNLTVTNAGLAFGSSDFSMEFWVYPTSAPANGATIWSDEANPLIGYYSSGVWYAYFGTSGYNIFNNLAMTGMKLGQWNHIALCRNSSTVSLFVNGARVGNATGVSGSIQFANKYNLMGFGSASTGYIAAFRTVIGSYVYDATQSSITVPTSPPTAVANTVFLANFTNAGIFDNAQMSNLETVGNAQVSTSVVKYGTGSMAFDGTGDNLLLPDSVNLDLGTGDLTIEFWLYRNNTTDDMAVLDGRSTTTTGYLIYLGSGSKIIWFVNAAVITGSTTIGSGSWYHIAITKSGTTARLFVNGVQDGSATNSTSVDSGAVSIGSKSPGASSSSIVNLNGYIDDLRITKGVARYITNFTPPIARMPNQ